MRNRIFATASFFTIASTSCIAAPDPAQMKQGQDAYNTTCLACHAPDGKGLPVGTMKMAPTLTDSPYVTGDPDVLALSILKGIVKETGKYVSIMAPLESTLDDKRLAAVMTFVRNSFGNSASSVTEAQARAARSKYAKLTGSVKRATMEALLAKTKGHEPSLTANVAPGTTVTKAPTQPASGALPDETYDVGFSGGTLKGFAEYLKGHLGVSENIIVPTSAQEASMPDLRLRNVTLSSIFKIIELATLDEPERIKFEEVGTGKWASGDSTSATGGFVALVKKAYPEKELKVRAFGLAGLQSDGQLDDVFALVSEAFKLQGTEIPRLRFHSETKTLLAVVNDDQAATLQNLVTQVIDTLKPGAPSVGLLGQQRDTMRIRMEDIERELQEFHKIDEALKENGDSPSALQALQKEMLREKLLQLSRETSELENQIIKLKLQNSN